MGYSYSEVVQADLLRFQGKLGMGKDFLSHISEQMFEYIYSQNLKRYGVQAINARALIQDRGMKGFPFLELFEVDFEQFLLARPIPRPTHVRLMTHPRQ